MTPAQGEAGSLRSAGGPVRPRALWASGAYGSAEFAIGPAESAGRQEPPEIPPPIAAVPEG